MDTPLIVGIDEAGRGPLAGRVVAAAVVLDPKRPIAGLADSKKLTERQREKLFDLICQNVFAYGVGYASVEEIDDVNILNATMLAMQRAYQQLMLGDPHKVLVDGNKCPDLPCPTEAIVKGDTKIAEISAASIVAKVTRDREMKAFDEKFPGYGFAKHKGYPTKAHREAIAELGPCDIHRMTFNFS